MDIEIDMPVARSSVPAVPRRAVLAATVMLAFAALVSGSVRAADLVLSKESLYNNIYVYREGSYVSLTFGYNKKLYTESIHNTWDEMELPVSYTQFMTLGAAYATDVHSVLEIGLGGGRTSWYMHKTLPNASVTTVELDKAVIDIAQQYFGVKPDAGYHVDNEDGRLFLTKSKQHYDVMLLDAYRGPFVPFHLLTKEFYTVVKQHLSPGGVLVQNVEPSTMLFDSAVATIHSVFPNIDFFKSSDGNIVLVAYDGPPRDTQSLRAAARERDQALHPRYSMEKLIQSRVPYDSARQALEQHAKVLTDDFAPVEYLKAIEKHNRKWPDPS